MSEPLQVLLPDNGLYQSLTMVDPLDPLSWKATRRFLGAQHSLSDERDASAFFEDTMIAAKVNLDQIYVSIMQDTAGRHSFVNLERAEAILRDASDRSMQEKLQAIPESDVKALQVQVPDILLLYARKSVQTPVSTSAEETGGGVAAIDDLCPHSSRWGTNYDVIKELSIGRTQRLILCDETTLCRRSPEEKIFEHLRLIVNCHEWGDDVGKYQVGSCSSAQKPAVIWQAVHEWHSLGGDDMNRANDAIQEGIWDALQKGTVAVHCLAGIHRAACIVACHFLWRHYALGHEDIPCDPSVIYASLMAQRPAVSPAYTHVLNSYHAHLKRRHTAIRTS
eukprot:gnl/MRDRNA2_/MRDRNA2_115363_c0_seq1.p1 gnl/MRDRNA2_/MRDRNA2_115363_c0~~gnl/MRDRNA2_/MRDRNA2_115363_c0_seq1.p1  ORF type:complete len:336 (-),score=48.29 gnl/MRDRNA2_/MRDRNA2_115363_c0_seq1:222-1229(-)